MALEAVESTRRAGEELVAGIGGTSGCNLLGCGFGCVSFFVVVCV